METEILYVHELVGGDGGCFDVLRRWERGRGEGERKESLLIGIDMEQFMISRRKTVWKKEVSRETRFSCHV